LQREKIRVYPEQSRVQVVINGGEIHAIVLRARMVPGDENASHCQQCQ
jgi:hypothetical protein